MFRRRYLAYGFPNRRPASRDGEKPEASGFSRLSRMIWGERWDLNPRPSVPQTDALPAELRSPLTEMIPRSACRQALCELVQAFLDALQLGGDSSAWPRRGRGASKGLLCGLVRAFRLRRQTPRTVRGCVLCNAAECQRQRELGVGKLCCGFPTGMEKFSETDRRSWKTSVC